MRTALRIILAAALIANVSRASDAHPPIVKGKVDFRRDILPIISAKCFSCHGPDETARKAKLRLDVRDEAIKDRKGTFAIKPGDLVHSELWSRINAKDPDDVMPPTKEGHPLSPQEIDALKKWIQQGAPYADHWAFIKPQRPALPKVKDKKWPQNDIDY